jgi:hypothetical protein
MAFASFLEVSQTARFDFSGYSFTLKMIGYFFEAPMPHGAIALHQSSIPIRSLEGCFG